MGIGDQCPWWEGICGMRSGMPPAVPAATAGSAAPPACAAADNEILCLHEAEDMFLSENGSHEE